MFSDSRLTKLFDLLVRGEEKGINPIFAPKSESFCRYPRAESILGMPTRQTNQLLEDLARGGQLKKQFYDKIIFCPACNSRDLRFVTICPKCGSGHIMSAKVLEHIPCGTLAAESEFRSGATYICPKCRRELRLLDSDYRMPGVHFKCHACGALTREPIERWRCGNCREELEREEIRELGMYSYQLAEVPAERSRTGGVPRGQIEDFLIHEGYEVQTDVKVAGRSGAVHEIDLLATKTSGTFEHRVVVGFATSDTEIDSEEVIKLYAKAYDVNAQDIVLVAVPRLSEDAVQFANHYRIKVLSTADLDRIPEKLLV
jgi:predicted RNA-binding Zn-ribbon protein involved in translation (DUF1610 family)